MILHSRFKYVTSPFQFLIFYQVILFGLLLGSWISTFLVAGQYNVSPDLLNSVFSSASIVFDVMYDKPWTRAGPYIVGLVSGYTLHRQCTKWLQGRIQESSQKGIQTVFLCVVGGLTTHEGTENPREIIDFTNPGIRCHLDPDQINHNLDPN